jgi:hypothetical protein
MYVSDKMTPVLKAQIVNENEKLELMHIEKFA